MTTFFVEGIPQTKGSTRTFMVKGKRYPVVTNDNPKNTVWARRVRREAQSQPGVKLVEVGPVTLDLMFFVPRPKRVKEALSPSATRPDLDKMVRSVGDALEGVCYRNDAQVASVRAGKFYSDRPGVSITVTEETL